jgi:hypothetical protein
MVRIALFRSQRRYISEYNRPLTMVPPSRRPVKRTIFTSCTSKIMVLVVGSLVLFLVALFADSSSFIHATNNQQTQEHAQHQKLRVLTATELRSLITDVAGDDNRMMRWDATEHTASQQAPGGGCDALLDAFFTLLSVSVSRKKNAHNNSPNSPEVIEVQGLACEFATFCITDNPANRASLHDPQFAGVHQVIVNLTGSSNSYLSAMACHVIYIASFANSQNHAAFYEAGAVLHLARIIKYENKIVDEMQVRPVQIMWAAAALQNLAASYCNTPEDGRCYWDWKSLGANAKLEITKDSLPIISDGSKVRYDMLSDGALVERLVQLTCQGPVRGKRSKSNPFPGVNAISGEHDDSPNVVPWAAAGAIKNLVLPVDASATDSTMTETLQLVQLQSVVPCLCRLAHVSRDWLEQNKGEGALHHLFPGGSPCWFGETGDDYKNGKLCVDHIFVDAEGYTCADYGDASQEECAKANEMHVTPNQACCGCGGGEREAHGRRTEEL